MRYLSAYSIPLLVILALIYPEQLAYAPVLFAFGIVPLLEVFMPPNRSNHPAEAEAGLLQAGIYDRLLYLALPVQVLILILFISRIRNGDLDLFTTIGLMVSTGITTGILGINVAHELGHRKNPRERFLAKCLLVTALYTHFIVEHNHGHHKRVGTPEDPASAPKGMHIYRFFLRSLIGGYFSAWKIQRRLLRKNGEDFFSFRNELLRLQLLQAAMLFLLYHFLGSTVMLFFLCAAGIGIFLLELINYIEHYGLSRKTTAFGFEQVGMHHSWNADQPLGRWMLFELTRHSDHHYRSSRKFQVLRHHEGSPQLPAGYPAMMLMALIPPLWFRMMDDRLEKFQLSADPSVV